MSDFDERGRREPDDDERREAMEFRRASNSHRCRCTRLDMPGTCPGPANCPLVAE